MLPSSLRFLVGLAAIAVIAAVGYYFYGEWSRADATHRTAVAECSLLVDNYRRASAGESLGFRFVQGEAKPALRYCVARGLVSREVLAGLGI